MKIDDFKLEVFFQKYEFTAPYLLTQSDCEAMSVSDLLALEPDGEKRLMDSWLGYTEVSGSPELRQQISTLFTGMAPDDIITHTGAQEAIFAYMNVLLEPVDHVICMYPTYQSLYEVAKAMGCPLSFWNQRHRDGRWQFDFDELESLIRPNTKLIVVNSPSNPTGITLTEAEINRLCQIAGKHGIYIFADEVYRGLNLDGQQRPWVSDVYDKATSLGVMSKAYGLAGLRIGWLATKDRQLISSIQKYKHYLSICNSSTSEVLAGIALRHGEQLLRRNQGIIEENLALAEGFFQRHETLFENIPPQCGPVAFHRLKLDIPVEQFCLDLVEKVGVLLMPGTIFDYDGPYFRMGYGRKCFAKSLAVFEQYLTDQKFV